MYVLHKTSSHGSFSSRTEENLQLNMWPNCSGKVCCMVHIEGQVENTEVRKWKWKYKLVSSALLTDDCALQPKSDCL